MKRGQISVYVIVGLVIVLITVFVVIRFNKNNQVQVGPIENKEIKPAIDYINSCVHEVAAEGIGVLGEQGLLYPEVYIASDDAVVSYFYFKGRDMFPEKTLIEEQLASYVEENLKTCINEFSNPKYVLEESSWKIKVNTTLEFHGFNVNVEYPITVYYGGEETTILKFNAEVLTSYYSIYKLSEKIVDQIIEEPEWINLENIQDPDFEIRLIKIEKNILVYEITDKYGLASQPYVYRFGVKYDF